MVDGITRSRAVTRPSEPHIHQLRVRRQPASPPSASHPQMLPQCKQVGGGNKQGGSWSRAVLKSHWDSRLTPPKNLSLSSAWKISGLRGRCAALGSLGLWLSVPQTNPGHCLLLVWARCDGANPKTSNTPRGADPEEGLPVQAHGYNPSAGLIPVQHMYPTA